MISKDAIEVRSYQEATDKPFIYSTWLKNYKYSSYFAKRIRPVTFFKGHHAILDHLLTKPLVKTLIAHPKDDEDTILGYLTSEVSSDSSPIVHFVFVKDAFRNMGIARELFREAKIDPNESHPCLHFTHWTIPVDQLIQKYTNIIYDPYAL